MEKRKWLWKRKSSERSPGETESSGSISSHSERNSDDQDAMKASPTHGTRSPEINGIQSPEVTSKAIISGEEVDDAVKILREKLSAALLNVSAKEDLVKQHAKVAEEAVAGWEKAENDSTILRQRLDITLQQKLALEDRVSHLDGALKECVRQLRQAREEQEEKIQETLLKKTHEWESTKIVLEGQIFELQTRLKTIKAESSASINPDIHDRLEYLENENSVLRLELASQSEELEVRTFERDLSTQAAETASKQHLDSIKRVAKLEAECRRLRAADRRSSSIHDQKSITASSTYVESLTDSQSDSVEQLSMTEIDASKMNSLEPNELEPCCSDSWASAVIAGLSQSKKEKAVNRSLTASSVKIDLMDDFVEMERLASLPEPENRTHCHVSEAAPSQPVNREAELKAEVEALTNRAAVLGEKLEKMEAEKIGLEVRLSESKSQIEASQVQLINAETRLEELQRELHVINEKKQCLESQLNGLNKEMEVTSRKIASLEEEVESERALSAENAAKCRAVEEELSVTKLEVEFRKKELEAEIISERTLSAEKAAKCCAMEEELSRRKKEVELHHQELEAKVESERALSSENAAKCRAMEDELSKRKMEVELRQKEELAVAAKKLSECQKTIESLGSQLKSLATLEDFLLDANLPEISMPSVPRVGESWKLHSSDTFLPIVDSDRRRKATELSSFPIRSSNRDSPTLSASPLLVNHGSSEKTKNGFGKLFSELRAGLN
ncbi:Filament-like plant protein [Dillenia turbinata]|uniref:Filament-like plant protein n=1 Tax=Dillenia turbinata TaxID=194707 RepID=A0AAN8VZ36_9MAGN